MADDPESSSKGERQALIFGLCAVLLWSTVATGCKLGLAVLEPAQLLFLGTLVSWLLFAVLAAVRKTYAVAGGEFLTIVGLGVLNPFLYYLILFEAYDRLPAQIAQPLNYTWAIALALLAVPILKQTLTRRTMAGIVVSYAGVVILLSPNPSDANAPLCTTGIGLALGSALLWASYWLYNTKCRSDPLAIMFVSFTVGLALVAAACGLGPGWPQWTPASLLFGAWIGLIEMGVTFLLWQKALKTTAHAGRISQLIFLAPFLSMILIGTVLGETIRVTSIAGLTVIVMGLMTTGIPKRNSLPAEQ